MVATISQTAGLLLLQHMASSSPSSSHSLASPFPSSSVASTDHLRSCSFAVGCRLGSGKSSEILGFHSSVNVGSGFRRACRAGIVGFSDEEISKQIEELCSMSETFRNSAGNSITSLDFSDSFSQPPPKLDLPVSIERKANRFDIPISLRIIQKQQQKLREGFNGLGSFGYCSAKKAFSSMVFIIRELQRCAVEMREALFYEDLQDILTKAQRELNLSFVWLFQKVFSGTPTLMVYVMILLANYTLHSVDCRGAMAVVSPSNAAQSVIEAKENVDPSEPERTLTGGDIGGGGGEVSRGSNWFEGGDRNWVQGVAGDDTWNQEEQKLWESTVERARGMLGTSMAEIPDDGFVAPVSVEIAREDLSDFFRTEIVYQIGLSRDPNNALLLCNYAQFLFLVARDHDKAEDCFRRALQVEATDGEVLCKYADFLWVARRDLWGAEEQYQQAIAATPESAHILSKYAAFLWGTGGEGTCLLQHDSD